MDPVQFYVVDHSGDQSVTLGIQNFPQDLDLEFRVKDGSWSDWDDAGSSETFTNVNDMLLTEWRIFIGTDPDNPDDYDTGADANFDGPLDDDGDFHSVSLLWNERSISFETAYGKDAVRPVPIPHSALLLGSGLFGLLMIGYRKRTMRE
jgi:hypothetical protein